MRAMLFGRLIYSPMNIESVIMQAVKEGWQKETGEPYEGSGYEMGEIQTATNPKRTQYKVVFTHPTKRAIQLNIAF